MQSHEVSRGARAPRLVAASLCALATFAALPDPALAFSAGSGTCVASAASAAPMGTASAGTGGYAFSLSAGATVPADRYLPGQPATLTLSGTTAFKGLLLYAEDTQGNRVGGFSSFNLLGYRLIDTCPGPTDATLTHNSALLKTPGPTFTWVAPATDIGPVTFKAIVLLGFNNYFVLSGPTVTAVSDVVYANGFEP